MPSASASAFSGATSTPCRTTSGIAAARAATIGFQAAIASRNAIPKPSCNARKAEYIRTIIFAGQFVQRRVSDPSDNWFQLRLPPQAEAVPWENALYIGDLRQSVPASRIDRKTIEVEADYGVASPFPPKSEIWLKTYRSTGYAGKWTMGVIIST